jgi:hypothetical protein
MANHPQITDDVLDELELVLVDDLDLSVRIRSVAELAGIWDAKSLWLALESGALLKFPGIGKASVRAVDTLFRDHLESVLERADVLKRHRYQVSRERTIRHWGWRPRLNWPDD